MICAESAAARAGLRNLEKSARADHLAASAAGRAIDRARAGLSAAAVTLVTGVELAHFDFLFHAESRFLERDLHVVTQIGAALAAFALGLAPPPKNVSKIPPAATCAAENFAENIERIVEPAAAAAVLGEGGMAIAIVGGAFLFVHQDIVSFAEFLEFLFRVRVVGIFVGMKFDRELAIRALDFLAGRLALDAQDS